MKIFGLFRREHIIERDTILVPSLIAESDVDELAHYLWETHRTELKERERLVNMLEQRARDDYQKSAMFRKQLKTTGSEGRERLQAFMRHWLSSYLRTQQPYVHFLTPYEFRNGQPLPPTKLEE